MAEFKDIVEQIKQRNLDKALGLCESSQNNKNMHIILNFMGVIHLLKNNLDLAETNFLSSAKIDEKFEDPIKNLYSICLRKNNLKILKGIANLGYRPTFNQKKILLEVHLFNFSGNLYNKHLSVEFLKFIRKEKKFKNINKLKSQINLDLKIAKKA